MENRNKKMIAGFFVLTVLVIGTWFYLKQSDKLNSPILARVGSLSITERDVAYKFSIERVYDNQTITGSEALQNLVKEAVEQEIAKKFDVFPMSIDISNFKEHVDKTTKAPELLAAVKNVFGTDTLSYERIYILPKIINPSLHTFFSNNKEINKDTLALAEKAFGEVMDGASFIEVAKKNGLQYATSTHSSVAPVGLPKEIQKYVSSKDVPKSKILVIVELLKPGEINKTIVEDDYSYSIVRLVSSEKGVYRIESIISPKRDYDVWYKEEAKKIPVEFLK